MGNADPSVLVVDDDPEFRDSVVRLLETVGLHTRQFASVPDFLRADPPEGPACLVLDVRMPGRSGLELQRDLAAGNRLVPIIFITAYADVPMTVQAMKGVQSSSLRNRSVLRIFLTPSRPASLAIAPVGRANEQLPCSGRVSTCSAPASVRSCSLSWRVA
jgi:CheY-like chemotaxis protein